MALSDKLGETTQAASGMPCSVGRLIRTLPDDEREALEQMLGPLGWSQNRIYDALVAEGHQVGLQTINRHRSRACRCYRGRPKP